MHVLLHKKKIQYALLGKATKEIQKKKMNTQTGKYYFWLFYQFKENTGISKVEVRVFFVDKIGADRTFQPIQVAKFRRIVMLHPLCHICNIHVNFFFKKKKHQQQQNKILGKKEKLFFC